MPNLKVATMPEEWNWLIHFVDLPEIDEGYSGWSNWFDWRKSS